MMWRDRRGRINVLMPDIIDFGRMEDPRHEYEEHVRRFANTAPDIHGLCWCGETETHWFHTASAVGSAVPDPSDPPD